MGAKFPVAAPSFRTRPSPTVKQRGARSAVFSLTAGWLSVHSSINKPFPFSQGRHPGTATPPPDQHRPRPLHRRLRPGCSTRCGRPQGSAATPNRAWLPSPTGAAGSSSSTASVPRARWAPRIVIRSEGPRWGRGATLSTPGSSRRSRRPRPTPPPTRQSPAAMAPSASSG